MKKLLAIILLLTSCKPTVYLSGVGEVVWISKDYIEVVFPCQNVKRPDCKGSARFDRNQVPNAYVGQMIVLQGK